MNLQPIVLEGTYVRLEPMRRDHHAGLCAVGLDPSLWALSVSALQTPSDMAEYVETALRWQQEGTALPFVTVDRRSGQVIGSTRYANVDHRHRRLEIGWTWVAKPWQRTPVNTQAKFLMLRHAFGTLGAVRVEFKTDATNERSRAAILRLGAKEEGILRKHMITSSGRHRDSVYFSITDEEWPCVETRLRALLDRPYEQWASVHPDEETE